MKHKIAMKGYKVSDSTGQSFGVRKWTENAIENYGIL